METRADGLYYLLDSDPLVTGKQSNPIMDRVAWEKKCNSIPNCVSAGEIVSVFNTFTNKKREYNQWVRKCAANSSSCNPDNRPYKNIWINDMLNRIAGSMDLLTLL